jgi:hypothetical protein
MKRVFVLMTLAWLAPNYAWAEYPAKHVYVVYLLQPKSVRSELDFTPEQTKAFVKKYHEYNQRIKEGQKRAKELVEQGKDKAIANRDVLLPIHTASDDEFKELLNADQLKRLEQIERQCQGYHAFAEPKVIDALKLTAKQKKLFKSIAEDVEKEALEYQFDERAFDNTHMAEEEKNKRFAVMLNLSVSSSRWALKMMLSHLTEEQEKVWQELLGKPFKITGRADPDLEQK